MPPPPPSLLSFYANGSHMENGIFFLVGMLLVCFERRLETFELVFFKPLLLMINPFNANYPNHFASKEQVSICAVFL